MASTSSTGATTSAAATTGGSAESSASTTRRRPSSASPLPEAYRASTEPAQAATPPPTSASPLSRSARPGAGSLFGSTFRRGSFHSGLVDSPYVLHTYSTRNNTILTLSQAPDPESVADSSSSVQLLERPVLSLSAGMAGFKGAQRGTYDAAVEVAIKMFKAIKDLVDPTTSINAGQQQRSGGSSSKMAKKKKQAKLPPPTEIEMVFRGFGQGRDAVFRTLMSGEGDVVRPYITRLTDKTGIKIGGTRPRKKRMV